MENEWKVQGVSIREICEQFGSPLYVYDGQILERVYLHLRDLITKDVDIFYSLKANPNITIFKALQSLGAGAEVSSLTELETVLLAGAEPQNIIFLGPGKTLEEIEACIQHEIYALVVESWTELELAEAVAKRLHKKARIALRINPAFSVKGSRLTMGGKPRQFGIDEAQVIENLDRLADKPYLQFIGIHVYMGTRILDEEVVYQNSRQIFELVQRVEDIWGRPLDFVDIGGGLGVPYFEGEEDFSVERLTELLNPCVQEFKRSHPETRLVMELGRFLVGKCGVFVSKVLYVKESYGEQFVITDGGTNLSYGCCRNWVVCEA